MALFANLVKLTCFNNNAMGWIQKPNLLRYESPECEVIKLNSGNEIIMSSIEEWGEEDLFGNG